MVEIGGVKYDIDRHGELQEAIITTTIGTPIGHNELRPIAVHSDASIVPSSFNHVPESQAPIYQQSELGWQYASDYTFIIHEQPHKRRRLSCKLASRIPHGRPPDTEQPP